MKSLRDKFKQKVNFVKPLYRKVKTGQRVKPMKKLFVRVDIKNDDKLCGDGIYVKTERVRNRTDHHLIAFKSKDNTESILPGACNYISRNIPKIPQELRTTRKTFYNKHNKNNVTRNENDTMDNKIENTNKSIQAENSVDIIQKIPDTWLRVYPAEQTADESKLSVVLRCAVCQLGLATFLVLWTMIWVFVLHTYEGPFESEVSIEFEKQQNQLVIDLATELRQITPLSPKWKNAIEKRIEDERKLTMEAMGRGAKLRPGEFWNLSGTFLFTIYVMTALGFGAPVPQTMLGRSCALIYAALAVPTHIYLMVNASTCLVANVESNLHKIKTCLRREKTRDKKSTSDRSESTNYNRNPELNKTPNTSNLHKKLMWILKILSIGRCVPIATVFYYTLGTISFGVLRGRQPLEIVMFPLEFTTTGGLEHVESYVRILYGFYVEGAMTLLACALATLRRHSCSTMTYLSQKYRLFSMEK